jgi:hypothetical protein
MLLDERSKRKGDEVLCAGCVWEDVFRSSARACKPGDGGARVHCGGEAAILWCGASSVSAGADGNPSSENTYKRLDISRIGLDVPSKID